MTKIPKKNVDILIVSDVHLGNKNSRSKEVLQTLQRHQFKKLILLGDIFDSLDFQELSQAHWKLLSYISKLAKKTKIIWVEGNHDQGLIKIMGLMVGVRVYKKYIWKHKGKVYLAMHGHQFDRFLINNFFLSFFASIFYSLVKAIDSKNQRILKYIKNNSRQWLRMSEKVANSAVLFGKFYRASYVFCGHTHQAMHFYKHKINYYNSGCWTDIPSKYITIKGENIKIESYK